MTVGELKELLKNSTDTALVIVEIGGSRMTGGNIHFVDGAEEVTEKTFFVYCDSVEPTEEEKEDWEFIHKVMGIKKEEE